jgi:transposase
MRYELTNFEWAAIRPFLPNKPRGVPRVNADVSSTASSGSCGQAHHGAICQQASGLTRPATIDSFVGERLASGT